MRDDNIISIFDVLLTETTLVTKANPGLGRNWDRYRRGPSFGRILDWSKRGPPHRQWRIQAANRTNWRHIVYKATTSFEVKRSDNLEDKRKRRKNRDPSEINTGQNVTCSRCGKTCPSRIGSISHQRAPDEDFLLPLSSFAK